MNSSTAIAEGQNEVTRLQDNDATLIGEFCPNNGYTCVVSTMLFILRSLSLVVSEEKMVDSFSVEIFEALMTYVHSPREKHHQKALLLVVNTVLDLSDGPQFLEDVISRLFTRNLRSNIKMSLLTSFLAVVSAPSPSRDPIPHGWDFFTSIYKDLFVVETPILYLSLKDLESPIVDSQEYFGLMCGSPSDIKRALSSVLTEREVKVSNLQTSQMLVVGFPSGAIPEETKFIVPLTFSVKVAHGDDKITYNLFSGVVSRMERTRSASSRPISHIFGFSSVKPSVNGCTCLVYDECIRNGLPTETLINGPISLEDFHLGGRICYGFYLAAVPAQDIILDITGIVSDFLLSNYSTSTEKRSRAF